MPVTVIAERIGWEHGLTILRDRVRELRPAYLSADPVSRTVYQPGELAQCDLWFPAWSSCSATARRAGHRSWSSFRAALG
jgi:hypothetical protein